MGALPNSRTFEAGVGADGVAPVFAFSAELEARLAIELERFSAAAPPSRQIEVHRARVSANEPGLTRVVSSVPGRLHPLREELALWRAFLSDEIEAILNGEQ